MDFSKLKPFLLLLKISTYLNGKIDNNLSKNTEIAKQKNRNQSNVHKILNLDNSMKKKEIENSLINYMCSTLDELSNDTTHNSTVNTSIGQN